MSKIIAVTNQKGGVGKTTTTFNLGKGLADKGKKVLLIDLDPQAHLTTHAGIEPDDLEASIYDVLKDQAKIGGILKKTGNMAIIPADISLATADLELSKEIGNQELLRDILEKVSDYDYILIDCPPSLNLLTINALCAATGVIVTVQAEYFALKGLKDLFNTVNKVKEKLNHRLEIIGILLCMYDSRRKLSEEALSRLRESFGGLLLNIRIRENVRLAEASSRKQSIFEYAPESHGAEDYNSLCKEILAKEAQNA